MIDTAYELDPAGRAKAVSVRPWAPTAQQYLVDDGQGDVATTTTTSQAVACTARFDPWGNPTGGQSTSNTCNTGSTPDTIFFKGGRRDATTGDYQLGSRTYDPSKASFLTPDAYRAGSSAKDLSIGTDPLTMNRYAALNGDPVNLVDPNGHDARYLDATYHNPCAMGCGPSISAHTRAIMQQNAPIIAKQQAEYQQQRPSHANYQCSGWDVACYARETAANGAQLEMDFMGGMVDFSQDTWKSVQSTGNDYIAAYTDIAAGITHGDLGRVARGVNSAALTTGRTNFGVVAGVASVVTAPQRIAATAAVGLASGQDPWLVARQAAHGLGYNSLPATILAGGVLAGAAGLAEAPAADSGAMLRGTSVSGQITSRGSWRTGTLSDMWNNAEEGPAGGRVCPRCGSERMIPPGADEARDWHGNHNPSWSTREFPANVTRAEVLDAYQQSVELLCPECNLRAGAGG
ncbi:MAG: hypothetical protein M3O87_00135 [Candidatus Dormibacteraeota bacterium]|nr:hypothetical protein [Candidatus Dormibacteraeota bacterium]